MRCGDVARNPGPDRVPIGSVKSLQITWNDGRLTWIKPYRVKISFAEIGAKVTVKWGKSKKPYPGIITGIELISSPTSLMNDSGQELYPPSTAKSVPCDPTVRGPRDQTAAVPNYDESHAHLRANNSATCTNSVPINVERRQASSQSSTPADAAQSGMTQNTTSNQTRPTCVTCRGVFRPQYQALNCSNDLCLILVHKQQQCSGLNREEQRSSTEWFCKEHGGSGPAPHSLDPTPASTNGPCLICKKNFRANLSPLICRSCQGGVHVSCTGIDRWNANKRRRKGDWECPECLGDVSNTTSDSQSDDLPRGKCFKCKRAICLGVRRAKCCSCNELFHRGCTGLTKDAIDPVLAANNWSCQACCSQGTHKTHLPTAGSPEESHEPKHTGPSGTLRILQWNADGINPKIAELQHFTETNKIDVAMIQETKLTADKRTPRLYGYTPVRADRPDAQFPGGGLLFYIKHNIAFRKIGQAKNGSVEAQSISVQTSRKKWLDLTNVYVPPGNRDNCDISWIPSADACIIAGDFNGHSKLWDPRQPTDKMGDNIVDYTINNSMFCCNSGAPTRINRGTGGQSSPDVTFASSSLANKVTWTTMEDLGSDHMPIIIEVKHENTQRHAMKQRRARWKRTKADWGSFTEQIEKKLESAETPEPVSFPQKVANFNKLLVQAGYDHVGKTSPKSKDSWMNPTIRGALKKRNLLRREVGRKRREWLQACAEAQELIDDAKNKAWEDYLSEVEFSVDPSEMWRVIRSLSGTPESLAPNEALIVKGKVITSNPKKADAFAKHYAEVSRLEFSKEERSRNRLVRKRMGSIIDKKEECCNDFSLAEMETALKFMKTKGAPGSDDIPPSFLKNLGPKASQKLLDILNESFRTGAVPRIWRHAVIIPIIKAGKPGSQLSSYRPISLTSCVVKLLERMLCSRLYYLAETRGWICSAQAGFRKNKSTEDQVLRITQHISDGFQSKPAKRTVLAMIDYSKAYDRVWRH